MINSSATDNRKSHVDNNSTVNNTNNENTIAISEGCEPALRLPLARPRRVREEKEGRATRKGTNGVSTNGGTALFIFVRQRDFLGTPVDLRLSSQKCQTPRSEGGTNNGRRQNGMI